MTKNGKKEKKQLKKNKKKTRPPTKQCTKQTKKTHKNNRVKCHIAGLKFLKKKSFYKRMKKESKRLISPE